ncbi:MAG: hypothetical protein WDA65_08255 [Christensenellales bacterium]
MRKFIAILSVAVLLLSIFTGLGITAFAANVHFQIEAVPAELTKGGNVKFKYAVSSDTEYTDCAIYYDSSTEAMIEIGTLNDMVKTGDFSMNVDVNMLDVPLTFHLKSGSGTPLATVSVTVKKKTDINLQASITPNRTMAAKGDTVKLTVKLENPGNVDVTSVKVSAAGLDGGKAFRDPFTLTPGQEWKFEYSFIMGSTDITFTPTIEYNANGAAQQPKNLEPITIVLESPGVVLSVNASKKNPNPGEEVTFELTITNNGNLSYSNMSVSLDGENEKFPSKRLNPGDSYSETYKRSFDVSTDVIFTVTLKNHMGETKSVSTTVSIRLPVDIDSVIGSLKLSVSADRLQLASAGVINFSGYVQNFSEYPLTDVRVNEANIGNIFAKPLLEPGERQDIQWRQDINDTTEYNFILTATDADGNGYTITADTITVTILSPPEPSLDFNDAVTLPAPTNDIGTTGVLLIIAGVLVLLIAGVGIALIVLWQKGRSPSNRSTRKTPRKGTAKKRPASRSYGNKSYRDRNNF